jgi:hypothetical protein
MSVLWGAQTVAENRSPLSLYVAAVVLGVIISIAYVFGR